MKRTVIHVNQHIIKANRKNGETNPPLTVKTYNTSEKAKEVFLKDSTGKVVAKFTYSPEKPLPCGAHVWFETDGLTVECHA